MNSCKSLLLTLSLMDAPAHSLSPLSSMQYVPSTSSLLFLHTHTHTTCTYVYHSIVVYFSYLIYTTSIQQAKYKLTYYTPKNVHTKTHVRNTYTTNT